MYEWVGDDRAPDHTLAVGGGGVGEGHAHDSEPEGHRNASLQNSNMDGELAMKQ